MIVAFLLSYAIKGLAYVELEKNREDLSQTVISDSHKGLIDLDHIDVKNGQRDSGIISEKALGE